MIGELTSAFRSVLSLSGVGSGDEVVVLADSASRADYRAAARAAAISLGAEVNEVVGAAEVAEPWVRSGSAMGLGSIGRSPQLRSYLGSTDMIVDVTTEGLIHAPWLAELLGAGTRILFACDPPEVLLRNIPKVGDKARAAAAAALVARSEEMHVTSAAGTDLRADLTDARVAFQCGFADDPGRWDHWPSCMVACYPRTSNGTIVLRPGDVIFPLKEHLSDEVLMRVDDGQITEVEGGREATLLREMLIVPDDPAARCISHMGWGLLDGASWDSLGLYPKQEIMGMEARSYPGAFLWSTGPDPRKDRWTPRHLDIPMRGCSVTVDGRLVVDAGVVIDG